ncbi:MAG: translation initiation factor IF-2 [Alphaproteobacteria bacterium]|nr:translation initiation factor IF-2 [Alphaproteobacteria bacterium]
MSDTKEESGKKPLTLNRPGKLELKKTVATGQVKQSFSHGRSKTVAVEVKKKRTFARGAGGRMAEVTDAPAPSETSDAGTVETGPDAPRLTDAERAKRLGALQDALHTEDGEPIAPEELEEAVAAAEEADEVAAEPAGDGDVAPGVSAAPDDGAAVPDVVSEGDDAARRLAEEEVRKTSPRPLSFKPVTQPRKETPEVTEEEDAGPARAKRGRPDTKRPARPTPRGEPRRRAGKLTINQALEEGEGNERVRSLASVRRAREREKARARELQQERKKVVREVVVPETITVQEFANRMAERGAEVVKALMKEGIMATVTQSIDADTAELIAAEFGHKVKRVSEADVEIGLERGPDDEASMVPRAPVVTVMGHVDHGKTSLLDALRETDVAGREAGGITQHIGAYQVVLSSGDKITFLDTPGHEAFTTMRARGAKVTDIVILVVAADDSVQPQTIEAINHAKAAEVPIIVAINKIDMPGANPNKVSQDLLNHEIVVESMGGEVLAVEVSAKEKTGLDKLEEAIVLQAELLELKANPDRPASGVVVEAKLEQGRGAVATVLIDRGTLAVGDTLIAGSEWGRVRALIDDRGKNTDKAGPSEPVEILGLNGVPSAGDDFAVVENEARAREIAEYRQRQIRDQQAASGSRSTVEEMFLDMGEGEAKQLAVVIKGDVQGSIEAVIGSLDKLATDEVKVGVLHSGVGGINESDVALAGASSGMVVGFNVRANAQARDLAKRDGVDIRYYSIIYDLIDDLKALLSGMLAPELRETMLGTAEVRQVFSITKVGNVAGCMIKDGTVKRGARVRLLRDDVVIHTGKLSTLKRFKDEVREVKEGYECGMGFENYNDIKEGDLIECYEIEEIERSL